MEKNKENHSLMTDNFKKEMKDFIEEGKEDINKFLYSRIPNILTIGEFEILSKEIYNLITNVWYEKNIELKDII